MEKDKIFKEFELLLLKKNIPFDIFFSILDTHSKTIFQNNSFFKSILNQLLFKILKIKSKKKFIQIIYHYHKQISFILSISKKINKADKKATHYILKNVNLNQKIYPIKEINQKWFL